MLSSFSSCTKDKVPNPPKPIPPGKWQLIPGTYKMYDTLGAFLYEMSLKHTLGVDNSGFIVDSLHYKNLDGQFDIVEFQMNVNVTNWPKYYFQLGIYEAIKDTNSNRWRIFGYDPQYYNDDTIHITYEKQNILYYMEDLAPYSYSIEKIIGVKVK